MFHFIIFFRFIYSGLTVTCISETSISVSVSFCTLYVPLIISIKCSAAILTIAIHFTLKPVLAFPTIALWAELILEGLYPKLASVCSGTIFELKLSGLLDPKWHVLFNEGDVACC